MTSLGPLGGIATTPVINRPEVAIIGPNKIVERPVFRGDDIVRAKLMNLSISCDHRVVDGWDAANYVQHLRKYLETPVLLFTNGTTGAAPVNSMEVRIQKGSIDDMVALALTALSPRAREEPPPAVERAPTPPPPPAPKKKK